MDYKWCTVYVDWIRLYSSLRFNCSSENHKEVHARPWIIVYAEIEVSPLPADTKWVSQWSFQTELPIRYYNTSINESSSPLLTQVNEYILPTYESPIFKIHDKIIYSSRDSAINRAIKVPKPSVNEYNIFLPQILNVNFW